MFGLVIDQKGIEADTVKDEIQGFNRGSGSSWSNCAHQDAPIAFCCSCLTVDGLHDRNGYFDSKTPNRDHSARNISRLAVFCTNSVNILAGINGSAVGQTVVTACARRLGEDLLV